MRRTSDIVMIAVLYLVVAVFLIWLAVWLAPIIDPSGLSATLENYDVAKTDLFNLTWCPATPKYILVFLLLEAFGGLVMATSRTNPEDPGSARLVSPATIGRYLRDKGFTNNRILSRNIRISITGRKAPVKSLNTLVIGGMGSGKSFYLVLPNLLQGNTSFVATDPSRELALATGWYQKYIAKSNVVVFDVMNPEMSAKYNFFEYIHDELDIEKTVQMLFNATVEKERRQNTNSDPMWEAMAQDMLYAYIALIWYKGLEEEHNIATLVYLMEEDFLLQDNQGKRIMTPVMQMFNQLDIEIPGNVATRKYRSATEGEVVTIRGVKSTLRGRIGKFLIPAVQTLLSRDELHLERVGKERTALYLCVANEDPSFNFLISLLYYQLFNELYAQAKANPGNHLDVPVQFFMDEMANFAVPDKFINYLTTGRKHWMSYMMFFQEKGQIEQMFDKEAETLIGTCNTVVYLGASGNETNKYFSDWIGEKTIDSISHTINRGQHGGSSENRSKTKRRVFNPDEMDTKIPEDDCLVYTSHKGWSQDRKYNPLSHPNYKYSAFGKEGKVFDYSGKENANAFVQRIVRTRDKQRKPDIALDFSQLDMEAYLNSLSFEIHDGM